MKRRAGLVSNIKLEPNTIIRGVQSVYSNVSDVSTWLGITESSIKSFSLIGDTISFYTDEQYYLNSVTMSDVIDLITSFEDYGENVIQIGLSTFKNSTSIDYCVFLGMDTFTGGSNSGIWQGSSVREVVAPQITGQIGHGTFLDCPNLETANYPNATSANHFAFINTKLDGFVDLSSVTSTGYRTFYGCKATELILDSVEVISGYGINAETFSMPNITNLSLKKCKSITVNNAFNQIKIGCVISINDFLKTSNGGSEDQNLTYAKNTRGCTVNFYDDNGDYVSTL